MQYYEYWLKLKRGKHWEPGFLKQVAKQRLKRIKICEEELDIKSHIAYAKRNMKRQSS
jgi:hypothetical protein